MSSCNIDKPIQSHNKFNWEKYKKYILHNSDNVNGNTTNRIDLERNTDKITQKIQAEFKENIYVIKHIATNHQIKNLTKNT